MTNQTSRQPIVLLIDKEESVNCCSLKEWLEENALITREARDVFEVIEEINDFTVQRSPDVILLEVESASQSFVEEIFQNSTEPNQIQVVPFTADDFGGSQAANLSRLKAKFNQMMPGLSRAA